jgi:hypothetical protein
VTDLELIDFMNNSPKLYHMAEFDSWQSIKERGLLSTSAILDLYEVTGARRREIEEVRRPASVTVAHKILPAIVIRDQIPMSDGALRTCLLDGLTPSDWYRLLNMRVFFWPSKERLLRLLGAKAYRTQRHDILEIDTVSLFERYRDAITLSPINSGATLFNPRPRGIETFSRIAAYPYGDRPRGNRVAEVAIDHSVPDIVNYVTRVFQMRGATKIREEPL